LRRAVASSAVAGRFLEIRFGLIRGLAARGTQAMREVLALGDN
jgi:hypothetical protein